MDPNRPHQHPSRSDHPQDRLFPFSHTQGTEDETDVRDLSFRQNTESGEDESSAASADVARIESQEAQGPTENEDSDPDAIMEDLSPRESGSDYVPSSSAGGEEAAISSEHLGSGAETRDSVPHQHGGLQAPTTSTSAPATPGLAPSLIQQGGEGQGDHSGSGERSDQAMPDSTRPSIRGVGQGYSHLYAETDPPRRHSYPDSIHNTIDPALSASVRDFQDIPRNQLGEGLASRSSNLQGVPTTEERPIGIGDDQGPQDTLPPAAPGFGVGNSRLHRSVPLHGAQDDRQIQSSIHQALRTHLPSTTSQSFRRYDTSIEALVNEELLRQAAIEQTGQSQSSHTGYPPSGDHTQDIGWGTTASTSTRSFQNPHGSNQQNPRNIFNPRNPPIRESVPTGRPIQYPSIPPVQNTNPLGIPPRMPFNQTVQHPALPPHHGSGSQGHNTGSGILISEIDIIQAHERSERIRQHQERMHIPRQSTTIWTPFPPTYPPNPPQRQQHIDPYNIFRNPRGPYSQPTHTDPSELAHGARPLPSGQTPISGTSNQSGTNDPSMGPRPPVQPPSMREFDDNPYGPHDPNLVNDDPDDWTRPPRGILIPPSHVSRPVQQPPTIPSNSESVTWRRPSQKLRDVQSAGGQSLKKLAQENSHLATTDVAPTVNDAHPGRSEFDKRRRNFCRMDPEGGFQVSEEKEGPWRKAIRHDTIRKALLDKARYRYGPWKHFREQGLHPLDKTSVHPDQLDWSENDRKTWPDILFQFEQRSNIELQHREPRGDWMWGDRVIVDRDNHPLTDWPRLNTCCSTKFEGWAMEALLRMCRKMTPMDIWQRTMPIASESKRKDAGRTAYNARRDRFRRRSGLIAWTQRPGSMAIKKAVAEKIGEWGREHNSTRYFEGFTKDELEAITKASKNATDPEPEDEPTQSGMEKEAEYEGDDEERDEGENVREENLAEEDDEDEDVIEVPEGAYEEDFEGYGE